LTPIAPRPTRPPLILASTSRYRRELLARLGWAFEVAAPAVAEDVVAAEAPRARARRLALAKASAVAQRHPAALVIGSDQVCEAGGRILDKPGSLAANRHMLLSLSGATATFHTAVAVMRAGTGVAHEHIDATTCRFREFSAAEIDAHLEREPALDCAGGFKVEGLGIALCTRVESSDPTGIIGLPLIWLATTLRGELVDHG
jgi:septum formation protein